MRAAIGELEEAVDVLTGGEGPGSNTAPDALWRVLLETAQLYDSLGDRARARTAAVHARRQAATHHEAVGRREAQALLAQLG